MERAGIKGLCLFSISSFNLFGIYVKISNKNPCLHKAGGTSQIIAPAVWKFSF